MKKAYSKTTLQFETLSVGSDAISARETTANFADGVCSVSLDLGGDEIIDIFQSEGICVSGTPDVSDFVCCHAPSDYNNVFC